MILEFFERIQLVFELITFELPVVNSNFSDDLLVFDKLFTKSYTDLLVIFRNAQVKDFYALLSGWYCELLICLISFIIMHSDYLLFLFTLLSLLCLLLSHHILVEALQVCPHGSLHVLICQSNLKVVEGFSDPNGKVWLIGLESDAVANK